MRVRCALPPKTDTTFGSRHAVALAVILTLACSNAASNNEGLGSSRVWVEGTVVNRATSQPDVNASVKFKVPVVHDQCGSSDFGIVYTNPPDIRTDSLGQFSAEVTAFGQSPGTYCVQAAVMTATIQQPGVRFKFLGDPTVDTLSLRIEVP